MHGSFTPDSAEKFLQLMAAAGYETRESTQNEGLENFSSGLNRQVDTWATAAENFSETRGEYIDNYDYTRCVRPDGSSYGTGGKCRKGTETSEKASPKAGKPAPTEEKLHSLMKKYGDLDRKIESATAKLGRMLKGKKYEGLRKAAEEKIKKLKAARKKIAENREIFNKQLNEEARRTGTVRQLMPKDWNPGFSEEENYDFTRCVRPDGSVYGSRGKCRKGTETAKSSDEGVKSRKYGDWGNDELRSHANELLNKVDPEKLSDKNRRAFDSQIKDIMSELRGRGLLGKAKAEAPSSGSRAKASKPTKELTPDEKWMQGRLATLKTLKGKSKQELLSILNQYRKIHGLTAKDSVRDLQGAILSSIHGNDSPSEKKEKMAARLAQAQRRRAEQKGREEEQSAIDQLSRMLPKGENIMDSLGNISIAAGGSR